MATDDESCLHHVDLQPSFCRMQRHVTSGWLAQLGEHQPYKLGVTGSNPVPPTIQALKRALEWFSKTLM